MGGIKPGIPYTCIHLQLIKKTTVSNPYTIAIDCSEISLICMEKKNKGIYKSITEPATFSTGAELQIHKEAVSHCSYMSMNQALTGKNLSYAETDHKTKSPVQSRTKQTIGLLFNELPHIHITLGIPVVLHRLFPHIPPIFQLTDHSCSLKLIHS